MKPPAHVNLQRLRNGDLRRVFQRLARHGWTITRAGSGHYKLWCPNPCRHLLVVAASASDPRAIRNMKAHINRTCWNGDPA